MKLRIIMATLAFIAGILASTLLSGASSFTTPVYNGGFELPQKMGGGGSEPDLEMPQDRIKESQISVTRNRVVLDVQNAQWSTFTPTKSMTPFLDKGANAIQVRPEKGCTDVEIGDVISYESEYADGVIIHRVVDKGEDNEGIYFKAKGDNNPNVDPGKIRCDQILRVLVAIIY